MTMTTRDETWVLVCCAGRHLGLRLNGSLGSLKLYLINGVRPLSWRALVLDRSKGPNLDLWLEPKDGRALACGLNRKDGRALFMNLKCKKDLYSLSLLDSTR